MALDFFKYCLHLSMKTPVKCTVPLNYTFHSFYLKKNPDVNDMGMDGIFEMFEIV